MSDWDGLFLTGSRKYYCTGMVISDCERDFQAANVDFGLRIAMSGFGRDN